MESMLKINGHNFKTLCYRHTLQKICKNNEHFFLLHFFHTLQALMLSLADYKLNISVTLIN